MRARRARQAISAAQGKDQPDQWPVPMDVPQFPPYGDPKPG